MEVTFCPPTKKCPKSRGVISLNKTAPFPGVERGGLETWKMGEVGSDLGRIFGRIFFFKGWGYVFKGTENENRFVMRCLETCLKIVRKNEQSYEFSIHVIWWNLANVAHVLSNVLHFETWLIVGTMSWLRDESTWTVQAVLQPYSMPTVEGIPSVSTRHTCSTPWSKELQLYESCLPHLQQISLEFKKLFFLPNKSSIKPVGNMNLSRFR